MIPSFIRPCRQKYRPGPFARARYAAIKLCLGFAADISILVARVCAVLRHSETRLRQWHYFGHCQNSWLCQRPFWLMAACTVVSPLGGFGAYGSAVLLVSSVEFLSWAAFCSISSKHYCIGLAAVGWVVTFAPLFRSSEAEEVSGNPSSSYIDYCKVLASSVVIPKWRQMETAIWELPWCRESDDGRSSLCFTG